METIIDQIKNEIGIDDKYGLFYLYGEQIYGNFFTQDQMEFEDIIWENVYPLPTNSGVRYDHMLSLGKKWMESDWNMQYFPEIHLFLSQATVQALATKSNAKSESSKFVSDLLSNMKEKSCTIIIHTKKNEITHFSDIAIPIQYIN